jgi:hypothetical protein
MDNLINPVVVPVEMPVGLTHLDSIYVGAIRSVK